MQGIVLGVAAVIIGLPVGLLLGSTLWHALTNDLGALDAPAMPWVIVATALPLAALWTTALAWWLFAEVPGPSLWAGAPMVLAGVWLATTGSRRM